MQTAMSHPIRVDWHNTHSTETTWEFEALLKFVRNP